MITVRRIITGMALVVMVSCMASASIIYNFSGAPIACTGLNTPVAGCTAGSFDWQYTAQLSGDQRLSAAATDFAVVFDFLGATSTGVSYSAVQAGLTLTTNVENTTATQPAGTFSADNAGVPNVRTNIAGSFTPPAGGANIFTIDIVSTSGQLGTFDNQSAQAIKNVPGDPSDGRVSGNITSIEAPVAPVTTPEPASLELMGYALLGLGGLGLLRRKRIV